MCCFPFSFSAVCCSGTTGAPDNADGGVGVSEVSGGNSFTFSKVVLTSEETKQYQLPWEKQQEEYSKKRQKSSCVCWCCLCACLCKPVHNRLRRRVSNNMIEKRATCYKQLIDIIKPTCEQIKHWSTRFDDLIIDEGGRRFFDMFLHQEHSEENLLFWDEVNRLKCVKDPEIYTIQARDIYLEFLKPLSSKEINIAGQTRRKIESDLEQDPPFDIYDAAQLQVYNMMLRQSYPRFLSSELFNTILQNTYAQNTTIDVNT